MPENYANRSRQWLITCARTILRTSNQFRLNLNETDRKHAQEVLRKSEQRFHAYVTASSDMVYRMNPDWTEMSHLEGRKFIPDDAYTPRSYVTVTIYKLAGELEWVIRGCFSKEDF